MSERTLSDVLRIIGTPDAVPDEAVEIHRVMGSIRKSRKVKSGGIMHTIEVNSSLLTIKELCGMEPNKHRAVLLIWDDAVVQTALDDEETR